MRIEANYGKGTFIGSWQGECIYKNDKIIGYTATHGRVTATAPTMHEAIALCACGVYQAKFIQSND